MARRKTLTDAAIAALIIRDKPYAVPDPELRGLYIRIRPTGSKTFTAVTRDPNGKQVWVTIGPAQLYSVSEARDKARCAIRAVREGKDRDRPETFEEVAESWLRRHVDKNKLISAPDLRSCVNRHLIPAWGGREFTSIRRGDVAKMLDKIEDSNGAVAADFALAVIRMLCNWYATRHEDYASPIVKGMRRTDPKAHARSRKLEDSEIKEVWRVAAENGVFGAFIRVALLTAQRREKVLAMQWDDLDQDEWIIPSANREKGTAGSLVLPDIALKIINEQPRFESNPYVFAGRGGSYMQGMSKRKAQFDAKLIGVAPWTVHDLRRTARSLMSRADVRPDISERVLGHAIRGVAGVYDRHNYRDEKRHALEKLTSLIEAIVNGNHGDKVVELRNLRGR